MSFDELSAYIRDLSQSGFDTIRLRVQLNRKVATPVITLIMAILAVPFALSMGKRGSLTGIAVAIGVAIAYFMVARHLRSHGRCQPAAGIARRLGARRHLRPRRRIPAPANLYIEAISEYK